jgi:hypothetical protein
MALQMQSLGAQLGTKSIGNWTATNFGGLGESTSIAGTQKVGTGTLRKSSSERFSKSQFLDDKVHRLLE